MLGGFGGREPVEIGTSGLSSLKDELLHLPVLDKTTVDPKVGVVLIVFLSYQELFGELGHLGLIVRVDSSTGHGNGRPRGSDVVQVRHDIYK